MRCGIIIQARLTSSRFPNKVLANLFGKPVLQHVLDNVCQVGLPVIVAIPENPDNDGLNTWLLEHGYTVFRGKQHDVLDRFYKCNQKHRFDVIIRVNGETPFVRPQDIQLHLERFLNERRFIYGDGCWIFSKEMLEEAWANEFDAETRQHVVRYFFNAIDYPQDIKRIENNGNTTKQKVTL